VVSSPAWIVRLLSGRRLLVASVAGALLAGAGWSWKQHGFGATSAPSNQYATTEKLVLHSVQRQSLPIIITERGTLSSQKETRIQCDLETVPGQPGTRILWLVPNGTAVKEGDLLVEFDSAPLKDRVNAQSVLFEQSRAAQIQASVRLENQKTQNETNLAAAKLRVEMAKLALKMYEDESGGTYKIALNDLESKIQEAKNQIK
jgi:HlyD family secretion protein